MNEGMVTRLARTKLVRKRPMLLGYIAAIITAEFGLEIARIIGWIR